MAGDSLRLITKLGGQVAVDPESPSHGGSMVPLPDGALIRALRDALLDTSAVPDTTHAYGHPFSSCLLVCLAPPSKEGCAGCPLPFFLQFSNFLLLPHLQ